MIGVLVREAADAAEFLDRTAALRGADPLRTNILGSIATGVLQGRAYDGQHWFLIEDDAGVVVAAALWAPPYRLLLSPMPDEAGDALGRYVAGLPSAPAGVIGPAAAAARVAEAAGLRTAHRMGERLLVLEDPVPAAPVTGAPRPATEADVELGAEWMRRYALDSATLVPDPEAAFRARLGASWFWEVEDEPVAYASHAPLVDSPAGAIARVGPVFTAAEHRRRGYGAAITWAVVEQLLDRVSTVLLFTDAANPTSNGVYERLGFRPVAELVDLDLL